jgi:predicted nucleotidyltransferase
VALRDPTILERSLDDGERRVVGALAAALHAEFATRLERIAVFGSRARGDVSEESDIDVLVVLRIPLEQELGATDRVWELAADAKRQAPGQHVALAPIVFAEARFNELVRKGARFARDVEREGISL